jgi:hypothetical protein
VINDVTDQDIGRDGDGGDGRSASAQRLRARLGAGG